MQEGASGPSEFGDCSGDREDLVGEGLQHGDDVGVKVLHRRFGLVWFDLIRELQR